MEIMKILGLDRSLLARKVWWKGKRVEFGVSLLVALIEGCRLLASWKDVKFS
jgi:hypothetical protein